jgi:Transposase DDE domain
MCRIIQDAVMRIKRDVGKALDSETVEGICRTTGHVWRKRELDPTTTLRGFLLQVLHGNTACSHVPRLLGKHVTAKAYGLARSRLPLKVFQQLLAMICSRLEGCVNDTSRWHGHRIWVMDGSGCSMPDTPGLQKAFGQPPMQSDGCGFPVAHLLVLFHVGTGMLLRVAVAPLRTADMALAKYVHGELQRGDVVLADRAFGSFGHLATLAAAGVHGVFRIQQTRIVSFRKGRPYLPSGRHAPKQRKIPSTRWIKWLGQGDQIVEYTKSPKCPSWLTREEWDRLPPAIRVRELRYSLASAGYRSRSVTLMTTLLDAEQYPANTIADLYGQRWQVETNLRHLKMTLGMDVLHTKSVDGIHKELAMFAIAYNLVRLVMLEAAAQQDVGPNQISFTDALRWLRHNGLATPLQALVVLLNRPGRHQPRVRKRRPKKYPAMKKPRAVLTQALCSKGITP